MKPEWILYRCPACGRSVALLGHGQDARCGSCRRPLQDIGTLPADFYRDGPSFITNAELEESRAAQTRRGA